MTTKKGHFIVLEGLDGTGKSTQIKLLINAYKVKGMPFHYIHFPRTDESSPVFGSMIAAFLRGDYGPLEQVHPELVALIYAGDRFNAADELRRLIDEGVHILCDRYVFSNIAFQCAKLSEQDDKELLMKKILQMEYDYFKIPEPDISIFLHVPIDFVKQQLSIIRSGADRNYLNGKEDIHEKNLDFQKAVEQIYQDSTRLFPDKLTYLSCMDESGNMMHPEIIHQKVLDVLKNKELF